MKKIVLAFTMFLATAGMAFAQADLQPIVTVKLGKSETITVKQLKSRVGLFEKQTNKKLTVDERKSVLEAILLKSQKFRKHIKMFTKKASFCIDKLEIVMYNNGV